MFTLCAAADSGVSEGLALTSDSESEIFCDSVDSFEQLSSIKVWFTHSVQVTMQYSWLSYVWNKKKWRADFKKAKKEHWKTNCWLQIPLVKSNGFHNVHVSLEPSLVQRCHLDGRLEVRQVGAGQGGEGAEDGKGHDPTRRSQDTGREDSDHNWREREIFLYDSSR